MRRVAFLMLVGDTAKYVGILFGLFLASFLITQQSGIFVGLMSRTYGAISDLGLPDIWVMDPKVQFIDDVKPLQDTELYRVRGVAGVQWAVPLYKGMLKARLDNGNFQTCVVLGLDDSTLIGGPPEMIAGRLADLHRADGVIIDEIGANDKLARPAREPGGKPIPLGIGDSLELNDHRAVVVGICRVSRTFQSNPVIYTTYNRATAFAPVERKLLSFVLVEAAPGQDPEALCARIAADTGLLALTGDGFKRMTYEYFMKYTGIPINFGIAVILAFLVGSAIAGLMFYNFTLDNLRHFGALKAMGAGNGLLLRMILLQSAIVGVIGWGLGVGAAAGFGRLTSGSELAFKMPWQLLALSGGAVVVICAVAALLSIWKVIRLEPAIVFKS
ncbi:MAG: FtsX-like permease family protein [Planctomycetes bacterium]|nr:FtsX-like permease family protein [Planctomycetota bacterium]